MRSLVTALTVVAASLATLPAAAAAPVAAPPALAPTHSVALTGTGIATYPEFTDDVARYGITTTAESTGTVRVAAATSDPAGRVRVNGRTLTGPSVTLTGLTTGDEIAVFFEDSTGTSRHSFIYLPHDFPALERTTPDEDLPRVAPGHVLLTLSPFGRPTPPALETWETAVDVNGVPAYASPGREYAMDLNRQPNGQLTVFRGRSQSDPPGHDLVLLDEEFQEVGRRRAVGLYNTDGHDAIVQPDGTTWFMSYEPRSPGTEGTLVDSVIQRVDNRGRVTFRWSSARFRGDAVRDIPDYAHINSFQVMADGNLLVSFRHFSSVFKIATATTADHEKGEVIWKLGGRDSSFDFAAGDLGPCAQHTARELPNGDILMFDNGSWTLAGAWCIDQDDPTGPPVQRLQTRIITYRLDEVAGTATKVSSFEPQGFFAIFAGSAQRLSNGNTMIGWAAEKKAVASEIDSDNELIWQLRDPARFPAFTYRAAKTTVSDVTAPKLTVAAPADGASYVEGAAVTTDFGCTDRGGSSLQGCDGPATLDTSVGTHTATFTARDGAGRTTTVTRTYTVAAVSGVDAAVRTQGSFVGTGVLGAATAQRVKSKVARPRGKASATVRVTNTGALPSALTLAVTSTGKTFSLKPSQGLTTPVLAPGQSWDLTLEAKRKKSARKGTFVVTVSVVSSQAPARTDAVSWQVKAKKVNRPKPRRPTPARAAG